MKDKFLYKVAEYIWQHHKNDLVDTCVVFPGHRASVFFTKYFRDIADETTWMPRFHTINELMQEISGQQVSDKIDLLFRLFKVYRMIRPNAEGFDEFYFWGEMFLNDFDDVDKYLVNTGDIFKNVENLKDLEYQLNYLTDQQLATIKSFWGNLNKSKLSSEKESFIHVWNILDDIYTRFKTSLKEAGKAYEGMIYRDVAEKLLANQTVDFKYSKYLLVGFNALNSCELALFDYLRKNGRASFFWDYDEYYINNKHHEAGFFLRENIKRFPHPVNFKSCTNSIGEKEKSITLLSVPTKIAQSKLIDQVLKDFPRTDGEDANTAIILSDENLLIPVLYAIPDSCKDVNVSMGYPLEGASFAGLVDHLVRVRQTSRPFKDTVSFYFKDVLALLHHPYVKGLFPGVVEEKVNTIRQEKKWFIDPGFFKGHGFLSLLFMPVHNSRQFQENLLKLTHQTYINMEGRDGKLHDLDLEMVYQFYLSIQQLSKILDDAEVDISLDTYFSLLKSIIGSKSISFIGEPLKGIQVMGVLETRAVDFDNILVLSMNEGDFPKLATAGSFIPYSLRKGFGLQTIEHQDAIYGYYFYRLLHGAKNIVLAYNKATEGGEPREMSRYLYQLKYEQAFQVMEKGLAFTVKGKIVPPISVDKSEEVLSRLEAYKMEGQDQKALSPSALVTYVHCPLKFYFQYVAGLREKESLADDVDPALFGKLLHDTIQILYERFIGLVVSRDELALLEKNKSLLGNALDKVLQKEFLLDQQGNPSSGHVTIAREVLLRYVKEILKVDHDLAPFQLISLEKRYQRGFTIKIGDKKELVNVGGIIDRVDSVNDTTRIIDYKSGNPDKAVKDLETLFDGTVDTKKSAILQTLVYASVYAGEKGLETPLAIGLYVLRSLKGEHDWKLYLGTNKAKHPISNYQLISDEFNNHLTALLEEIYNPAIPFVQTKNIKNCTYCEFKQTCNLVT